MSKMLIAALLMAGVTYIPRVLPIVMVKSKLKSRWLRSFLYYVPFAVLGAMTFPGILYSTGSIYSAIAGLGAALILGYYERGLMMVAVSAIIVVSICELLL